jgi:hypothetical protein
MLLQPPPAFYARERCHRKQFKDHPWKPEQRDSVCQHFRKYVDPQRPLHVVSLPGEGWLFEHQISKQFPDATFLGFEHDLSVLRRSRANMPGGRGRSFKCWHPSLKTPLLQGYANERAVVVHTLIENLPILQSGAEPLVDRKYRRSWELAWSLVRRPCTAIWVDLDGVLESRDQRIRTFLQYLPDCLDQRARAVPIVITACNNRGKFQFPGEEWMLPEQKRYDYAVKGMNQHPDWSFATADSRLELYQGVSGRKGQMLMISGKLRNARHRANRLLRSRWQVLKN